MRKKEVRISVRSLVEFVLRSGDIDSLSGSEPLSLDAMLQGGFFHRKLQKEAGPSYRAEVPLSLKTITDDGIEINVSGRADGIISEEEMSSDDDGFLVCKNIITIDEIKGTYRQLSQIEEPDTVHLAQARVYAWFFIAAAKERDLGEKLSDLYVQVTYVNMKSGETKRFRERQDEEELAAWYKKITEEYAMWLRMQLSWDKIRDDSIRALSFPFEMREGQRRLISAVYQSIVRRKRLFAMAPTGTGKTISAIYPAIQAMGSGMADKIFYATAKTVTGETARDTMRILRNNDKDSFKDKEGLSEEKSTGGLRLKSITLTAKDKICIFDKASCSPVFCSRAAGHFDRINEALFDLVSHEEEIGREIITSYAQKYSVCPFELQLDASLFCDLIICDYNYIFDPDVYLRRFFAEGEGDYIFLIDECHNLVERARNMYSSALSLADIAFCAKKMRGIDRSLSIRLGRCRGILERMKAEFISAESGVNGASGNPPVSSDKAVLLNDINDLISSLTSLLESVEDVLKKEIPAEKRDVLIQTYFDIRKFTRTWQRKTERYVISAMLKEGDYRLSIMCMDPSKDLSRMLEKAGSSIFFSATLLPIHYYKEMLSDSAEEDYDIYIDSPFDPSNRLLMTSSDVSSLYSRRNRSEYERIARYIYDIIRAKYGNYMVFFPSYRMMEEVYQLFAEIFLSPVGNGLNIILQRPEMKEEEREEFLAAFVPDKDKAVTGFCVMGGIFSEGIDLKAEMLIGVIVIGTGLPGISPERELVRAFFDRRSAGDGGQTGFEYAYLYPGINKVMQAAGRVIRSHTDKGIIALLDERFSYAQYARLLPREWQDRCRVNAANVSSVVEDFWTKLNE